LLGVVAALLLASGCGKTETAPQAQVDRAQLAVFAPLPDVMAAGAQPLTEEKIQLGRMLYFETRLSKNQQISCNSCHVLSAYGVDNEPVSDGHKGQRGDRNSPTVYNAAAHFVQFWDGRAADVEEQAKGPVLNPVEMAMGSAKDVETVLKSMPEYVAAFKKAFPNDKDPVTYNNAAAAIGAFERKLVTPSRWDRYLKGEEAALTVEEKSGMGTFITAGCQTCHSGALLGGSLFQRIGLVKPYPDSSDPGRFKVTKNESDKMMFKVPSLRNVEKTEPYFHNGKVASLDKAVAEMADYQLGRAMTEKEVASVVAFLKTLTGDLPAEYIKPPVLPKSTAATPKPVLD
jgi:cytochrome c peroxidase